MRLCPLFAPPRAPAPRLPILDVHTVYVEGALVRRRGLRCRRRRRLGRTCSLLLVVARGVVEQWLGPAAAAGAVADAATVAAAVAVLSGSFIGSTCGFLGEAAGRSGTAAAMVRRSSSGVGVGAAARRRRLLVQLCAAAAGRRGRSEATSVGALRRVPRGGGGGRRVARGVEGPFDRASVILAVHAARPDPQRGRSVSAVDRHGPRPSRLVAADGRRRRGGASRAVRWAQHEPFRCE